MFQFISVRYLFHAAVSPKWVTEPKDEAVLAGEPLALHCQTTGSPTPQVTWLKQRGKPKHTYIVKLELYVFSILTIYKEGILYEKTCRLTHTFVINLGLWPN